jgi:hypothetical protein
MGHIGHPQLAQVLGVAARLANIGDEQSAIRFEHAYGFVQGFTSTFARRDIMDGQTGEHQIKSVVGEGKLSHVGGIQLDPLGNAFPFRVLLGGRKGIP